MTNKKYTNDELIKKWTPVLEHADLPPIKDYHRRVVTANILENTRDNLEVSNRYQRLTLLGEAAPTNSMGASSSTAGDGALDTFDPILISLIRRAMPNLVAYDICGVQQMNGPTGLIFALRTRYATNSGTEAFYNEANTGHSARGGANATAVQAAVNINANSTITGIPGVSNNVGANTYNFAGGMSRSISEGLGGNTTAIFPEMAFSIEKVSVTAMERALKAEWSMEMAQDLKAIHGLDAESLLSNLLQTELLAEINREVVRTINGTAVPGSQVDVTSAGTFDLDVDANGRWMIEKFKGLHFQLQREANQIAKDTRRGRGNLIICSSDVASALQQTGQLDYKTALTGNSLEVDDTGNTFVGVLNGQFKVFIDPYAIGANYMTVGYKGKDAMDAGLFYCPYVPLQLLKGQNPDTFQPKLGFKTRYGMVANPFSDGSTAAGTGALTQDTNVYYRRTVVTHIG
jgi:hypothetical protein